MTLHHTLYRKLTVLIPTLPEVPEYAKFKVPGFMDLNLDLLSRNDEIITVALSHYYEQNGDLIPDPDMVIRIDTKIETVEALTFQRKFHPLNQEFAFRIKAYGILARRMWTLIYVIMTLTNG
jgi:hypothetical protein